MKITAKQIISIIKVALKEDIGQGDITTRLIVPAKKRIRAVILAKEKGIVCGLDVARLVFKTVDRNIRFRATLKDGKKVRKGRVIAQLAGDARNILRAERVALNFLARLSGIATLTANFVQRVKPYPVKIMDTRKTTPGLRILEKYAVRCGGGFNHRMGLWDGILVKDNHLLVASRLPAPWRSSTGSLVSSKRRLKKIIAEAKQKKPKGMKIEVEVGNLQEFKEVLLAKPDIIMLDNFSLSNIKQAVKIISDIRHPTSERPKLEVSGGVSLNNVRQIAACGVEMISVGELTHSAKALDVTLNCE